MGTSDGHDAGPGGAMTREPARRSCELRDRSLVGVLAGATLVAGCSLDSGGLRADAGGLRVDAGRRDGSAAGDAGASDAGSYDAGADGGLDAGAPCDPSACALRRCVAGACALYASCRELHTFDSGAPTGVHAVDFDGAGGVPVWCDMETDGGGWTLVGRSARGSGAFGWTSSTGGVTDDALPYSLGAGSRLAFSQVLVGNRSDGKTWGDRVYRFDVPPAFVDTYALLPFDVGEITTIAGTCAPLGGPRMLSSAGYTSLTDHFFLRDVPMTDVYGLGYEGWFTLYSSCDGGGDLDGDDGMIMVR